MSLIPAIANRHSIRSFKAEKIDPQTLEVIIHAGLLAPSGMNRQPVRILHLRSMQARYEFVELFNEVNGRDGDPYYNAPDIVLVLAKPQGSTYEDDGALALMNMMLQATEEEVASCWIHHIKEVFKTKKGQELLKKWNLDTDLEGIGSLALGYADGEPRKIEIKPDRYYIID